MGGGIDEGAGVPFVAGVVETGRARVSPLKLVGAGSTLGITADDSFDGESSLIWTGTTSNLWRSADGSLRVMIILPFEDFRRAPEVEVVLFDEAIVRLMVVEVVGRRRRWIPVADLRFRAQA